MSSASSRPPRIVFLKERKSTDSRAAASADALASAVSDPYELAFTLDGAFACSFAPVLRFEFDADGLERLAARLAMDEGKAPSCGGIICTSVRAIEALELAIVKYALPEHDQVGRVTSASSFHLSTGCVDQWRAHVPVLVVGEASADAATAAGWSAPLGCRSCGSARALAQFLTAHPPALPLLFLSGNQRLCHLPDALRDAGVAFDELPVYRTMPLTLDCSDPPQTGSTEQFTASHSPTLEAPVAAASAAFATDCSSTWLAFFSPSGVAAATESFGLARLLACRRAAIGPTTAAALADAQLHAHAVAQRPAPDALRAAIERAIEAAAAEKVAAELQ